MKYIITLVIFLISFNSNAQFFKSLYDDFVKYGTVYAAGNIGNAKLLKNDKSNSHKENWWHCVM